MGRRSGQTDINAAERARQAINLRKQGWSLEAIREACGYADRSGPFYAIKRALDHYNAGPTEALRTMESWRLDDLLKAFYTKALAGDTEAAGIVLRCIHQRSKLYGLEMDPVMVPDVQVVVREVNPGYLGTLLNEPSQEASNGHAPVLTQGV